MGTAGIVTPGLQAAHFTTKIVGKSRELLIVHRLSSTCKGTTLISHAEIIDTVIV